MRGPMRIAEISILSLLCLAAAVSGSLGTEGLGCPE